MVNKFHCIDKWHLLEFENEYIENCIKYKNGCVECDRRYYLLDGKCVKSCSYPFSFYRFKEYKGVVVKNFCQMKFSNCSSFVFKIHDRNSLSCGGCKSGTLRFNYYHDFSRFWGTWSNSLNLYSSYYCDNIENKVQSCFFYKNYNGKKYCRRCSFNRFGNLAKD